MQLRHRGSDCLICLELKRVSERSQKQKQLRCEARGTVASALLPTLFSVFDQAAM